MRLPDNASTRSSACVTKADALSAITLLLPSRALFSGRRLPAATARVLGRADRLPMGDIGEQAQTLRHFDVLPRGWPIAALTRDLDAGDAASDAWLRADPAWLRPDINGARLMACGDMLRLTQQDVDAFLPALRPLLGDAGFILDAPTPARWYVRLPREAKFPSFSDPADALGADVFDHLPGADDAGSQARRWRALASEVQITLHNHPRNAQREAAGQPPVNALWFWGAGALPDRVWTRYAAVYSNDPVLAALAGTAKVAHFPLRTIDAGAMDALYDIRDVPVAAIIDQWIVPATTAIARSEIAGVTLDFADGCRIDTARRHRWRLWRKSLASLDA